MREYHRFRSFFAWEFEKEEKWINKLAMEKGLYLQRVGCCHYVFQQGEKGKYIYRLELLRRTAKDEAEKQYLRTIGAEEVCRNGDWEYYRIPAAEGPFAQYACCDSKLNYLKPVYIRYLIFGIAVYIALAMDMTAFLAEKMTPLYVAVLTLLTVVAFIFTIGLTSFSRVLKRLKKGAQEERRL